MTEKDDIDSVIKPEKIG